MTIRKVLRKLLVGKFRKDLPPSSLPKNGIVEISQLGFRWRLDIGTYIGRELALKGVFERATTDLVLKLVQPGMHVLDIGANIGYYTLLLARAVGPTGKVWAFEPTIKYRQQLQWHLENNGMSSRVVVVPYGLSDTSATLPIAVGDTSATLHQSDDKTPLGEESIELRSLDEITDELQLSKVDFIKIDTDGHEPRVLRGASNLIGTFLPPISLEFAQHCLHFAGSDVREQIGILRDFGYEIYSEKTGEPYRSEMQFLRECGNFTHSCNALAIPLRDSDKLALRIRSA